MLNIQSIENDSQHIYISLWSEKIILKADYWILKYFQFLIK